MKLIKEFMLYWYKYTHTVNLYYKPYKSNILGEHIER